MMLFMQLHAGFSRFGCSYRVFDTLPGALA
jgi:hypothetical protein